MSDVSPLVCKEWLRIRKIYVDFAATTPVDPRVLQAMQPFFTKQYGNASAVHSFGVEAKTALEQSRETMAEFMNADPGEVVFTGSATEANNLVLKGHAFKEGKDHCHLAVSVIDHDCVLNSAKWLEKAGYKVTFLPVDQEGFLSKEGLEQALNERATLVSVVHGNNEIGTIQEAEEIAATCHQFGALFHTDAVQTFGKVPINVKTANFDFMTINAHKIYGPKGVGALYIRDGLLLEPLIHGGGHEFGLRSGTENIPGIVGFAKAMELRKDEMKPEAERLTLLRDQLITEALEIDDSNLNGPSTRRLYNNVNLRFAYIEGESIVLALDTEGIAASSGSACSSTSGEPSHVLRAIGLKPEDARGSLRLSLGKHNTQDDVDYILEILPRVIERLRTMSPLNRNSAGTGERLDLATQG